MFVLFLHGPAAAGKHTIGSILSGRLGLPLFHNHLTVDLVSTLFEFGSDGFVGLRAEIWKGAFRRAAEAGRSFIFTFNPEATVQPELIGELERLVTDAGGVVHYVELCCSDAVVVERIALASRSAFGKLTDPDAYREIRRSGGFDFPALPEALVRVDTERLAPEAAAACIVEALNAAG
jgi:hypothetical protein